MQITVRVPRIPVGALSNVVGLAGLVLIVVAVGLLAGWAWALGLAGVFCVGMAALAQAQAGTAVSAPAGANVTPIERRAG